MRYEIKPEMHEHLRRVGIASPPAAVEASEAEYDRAVKAWKHSLPGATPDELHARALAHIAWKRRNEAAAPERTERSPEEIQARTALAADRWGRAHAQLTPEPSWLGKLWAWLARLLGLSLLVTLFWCAPARAQFSHINTVTVQNSSGTQVAFFASPFTIKCLSNLTCTQTGSTLTINSSGGGGSGCVPGGSSGQILEDTGSGGCTDSLATDTGSALDYNGTQVALTGADINTSNDVTSTHLASALPIAQGGTAATTAANARISLFPAASEVGDLAYCATYSSGCTSWALLAGNTSGTKYLQETSAGAPSWTTPAGGVTSVTGDGTIINNSGSVGAVTLTLANTPTGSGGVVLATSPTLVTPALGTPSAIVLTHATSLPCAAMPSLTGDTTTSATSCATSTVKVNGNTPGGSCTNQVVTSVDTSARPTCSSVTNADLSNSAVTIAGVSVSLGGSTSSFPSPGAIGATTPAAATFTTLTATSIDSATNCSASGTAASPSVVSCSAAPAGQFSCATNASGATCTIDTSAIAATSEVFIQPDSGATISGVTCNTTADTGLTAPRLASRSSATSFTLNLGTFSTNPLCFDYFIVNP